MQNIRVSGMDAASKKIIRVFQPNSKHRLSPASELKAKAPRPWGGMDGASRRLLRKGLYTSS